MGGRPGRPTEVDSGRTDGREWGDTRSTRMRSTALRGFWAIRAVGMAASTGSQITPFAIHSTQVPPDPGIGEGDSTKYRGPSAIFSSSPRDWSGCGRWTSSCRWEVGITLDGADKLEVCRHGSSRAHPGRHRALNSIENRLRGRRSGGRCEAGGGLRRGGPADRRANAGPAPSNPLRSAPRPALPTPLPPPDSATHDTWRRLV